MKIQSVVFLTAVLILTTLVAETECIGPGNAKKMGAPRKGFQAFAYKVMSFWSPKNVN